MTPQEFETLIATTPGAVIVDEPIVGVVHIRAGIKARYIKATIKGSVVAGGLSLPGAPMCYLQPKTGTETHALNGTTRAIGMALFPDMDGDTPVLRGVTLDLNIVGDGSSSTGLYAIHCADCTFRVNVMPTESSDMAFKVHGVMLAECARCNLVINAFQIGSASVGTGYGCELAACNNCLVTVKDAIGCRYGASLSCGGFDNVVVWSGTQSPSVACADVHGGGELRPTFIDCPTVKPFNESWREPTMDPRYHSCGSILQEITL